MKFRYTARTKQGGLQTGFIEAVNREAAFNILVGHELLLSDWKLRRPQSGIIVFRPCKPSKIRRCYDFTRQFATLLDAQISLSDALKNIYKQTRG